MLDRALTIAPDFIGASINKVRIAGPLLSSDQVRVPTLGP
jgi:hypothetical protein